MSSLEALLVVQDHDTTVDQLHHRRAHLPERAELDALGVKATGLQGTAAGVRARRDAVLARQTGFEEGITAAGQRIKDIEGRLYSGQVSATKDILAMTAEVESLKARRSALEDDLLAAMEEDEPLAGEQSALEAELAALGTEGRRLLAVIAEAELAIDAEVAGVQAERAAAAATLPEALVATYEQLRSKLDGVGAARLVGRSCSGCHLALPAQEVDRLKREPADAVVVCEQCGRILVR